MKKKLITPEKKPNLYLMPTPSRLRAVAAARAGLTKPPCHGPYVNWGAHNGLERRIKEIEDTFIKFLDKSEEESPEEESSEEESPEEEEIYGIDKVDNVEEGITATGFFSWANFTKKSWEKIVISNYCFQTSLRLH